MARTATRARRSEGSAVTLQQNTETTDEQVICDLVRQQSRLLQGVLEVELQMRRFYFEKSREARTNGRNQR